MRLSVTGVRLGVRRAAVSVAAVVVIAAMVWLGVWQWERSAPLAPLDTGPPVPLAEVAGVGERVLVRDVGRRVTVSGQWRPDRQLLVADREEPGEDGGESGTTGRWVLTAVQIDGAGSGGAGSGGEVLVPVVRGWVPAGTDEVPAPTGDAEVSGWLQGSEPLDLPVDIRQPPGVIPLVSAPDLVNRWPEDVTSGFAILDSSGEGLDSAGSRALAGISAPLTEPAERAGAERDWRNLAYAAQWFLFAGFTVLLWWRVTRDMGAADAPAAVDRQDVTS